MRADNRQVELADFRGTICAAALSRAFSSNVLAELVKSGFSKTLATVLGDAGMTSHVNMTDDLGSCFDLFYTQMKDSYRNEYVYKNTIANKILLGRHSLNTAAMHTEFRVSESKADVLVVNGTSHIYEIKTELDGLDRLEKQLEDYRHFAEYVSIVTSDNHIEKLLKIIDPSIGVLLLTNRQTLKVIRPAVSDRSILSPSIMFDSLRKSEYSEIIKSEMGFIPEVPNTLMYRECKEIFERINIEKCHNYMVSILKKRDADDFNKNFIRRVPVSLKALAASSKFTKSQKKTLLSVMDKSIGDCLH